MTIDQVQDDILSWAFVYVVAVFALQHFRFDIFERNPN